MRDLGIIRDLAKLFEYLPEVQFWIKDKEGRFLSANPAFLRHFNFTDFDQLAGKTDRDISPPHLARDYVRDDRTVLSSGKALAEKLELVQEKDRALNWYATSKVPLRDGKGHTVGTAGFTRRILRVNESRAPGKGMDLAIGFIHRHYGDRITVKRLAGMAGLSVVHFERKFRQILRETPLKYLIRIRMRAACSLLIHSDLSVAEISRQTGHADPSYFTKRFFAHLRIRPLEYRRKYG